MIVSSNSLDYGMIWIMVVIKVGLE